MRKSKAENSFLSGKLHPRIVLLSIFFLLIFYLVYNLFYLAKVFPNVYLANEPLSGRNKEEVSKVIEERLDSFEDSRLTFEIEGDQIAIDLENLGISFDKRATFENIFLQERSGEVFLDLEKKIKAPFVKTKLTPVYRVNFAKLTSELASDFAKYEKRAQDATIKLTTTGSVQIGKEEPGVVVNKTELARAIFERLDNLSEAPIKVLVASEQPKVKASGAQLAFEKVKTLKNQRIVLTFGTDVWRLESNTLFSILNFYPSVLKDGYISKFDFGNEPIVVKQVELVDSPEMLLEVGLDEGALDDFIVKIARVINRPTVDATLRFENGRVVDFIPAVDGQKLDQDLLKKIILEKISINTVGGDRDIRIGLPVTVTRARIASEEINSLGIKELLGRGVSYFSGSIANRIYNLALGASRISGTLVGPGEVFSFNGSAGEVSKSTGYRQAYVISEGRTVLDDGGGICQVSSTVFRAALAAGLPIVARTAHAYRVFYYEQGGFGPGLDATVWAPAVDFKFKNDTNRHILVQATVDYNLAKLQVDIYGSSDGRKVEMTKPVILSQSPALPDKYQDDPTLPKGTIKQVDFAAAGAVTVFSRKVTREDKVLIDESFRSNFRPWQAVYLVGTGG